MTDEEVEPPERGPSLELPKLFRRRGRSDTALEPAQGQQTSPPEADEVTLVPDEHPQIQAAYRSRQARPPEGAGTAEAARPPEGAGTAEAARPPEAAQAPEATRPPEAIVDQASGPEPEQAVKAQGTEQPDSTGRPAIPQLPEWAATPVTGLVVGLVGAVLTDLGLRGCQAMRGTSSCGGTGVLMLIVILLLMGFLGGFLLRIWQVGDARGTSFIGVGLICVVVLIALLNVVFSPWMFLAVPLIGAAAYLAADWVTTTFVEPTNEGPGHDVR